LNQNKQNLAPQGQDDHQNRAAHFMKAVESIFHLICRLFVRRGIGITSATTLLKRAFLKAADDLSREQGITEPTVKRLALYTGLPVAEIRRIQQPLGPSVDLTESQHAALTSLLAAWHLEPRYTMPLTGLPLDLPFDSKSKAYTEGRPTFVELAQEVGPQHDPRELLDELVNIRAVVVDPETNLSHVMQRVYIPESFAAADSEQYGRRVTDFLKTLDINSRKKGPGLGHFDRDVKADFPMSLEDEAKFHAFARQECQNTLEKLDTYLRDLPRGPENGRRPGVTIFYYINGIELSGSSLTSNANPIVPDNASAAVPEAGSDHNEFSGRTEERDDLGVIDTLNYSKPRGRE
jgi:Family of unknown function (DUF6502)